jgi:hypothetical protein
MEKDEEEEEEEEEKEEVDDEEQKKGIIADNIVNTTKIHTLHQSHSNQPKREKGVKTGERIM